MERKYIRTYRILTIIFSSLLIVLILSAWIRESFFREWKRYQHEYKRISEDRLMDAETNQDFPGIEIGIRQLELQDLKRVDRCICCHMGIEDPGMSDTQQPHTTHSGDFLIYHPPQKYGCTICHGGQGRALDKEEAFGRTEGTHWPFPLLDQPYIQSSCGKCHLTLFTEESELAETEVFREGQQIFYREGCLGCHRARGVGGTVGPDLTEQGEKTKHEYSFHNVQGEQTVSNWLKEHFRDPEMVSPGSRMLKMNLPEEELEALVTFTMGLAKPDIPFEYFSIETLNELKGSRYFISGNNLYQYCCSACHGKNREGKNYNEYETGVPALRNRDFLGVASPDLISFTILNGRSWREMASWLPEFSGFYEYEIDSVVKYIRSNKKDHSSFETAKIMKGDETNGQIIYDSYCMMCHGKNGEGLVALALNNKNFLRTASDGFLYYTIHDGRYNTAMPSWSWMNNSEMADLLAFIRSWGVGDNAVVTIVMPEGNPQQGALQYHYMCSRCHGEFGEGETGPAILNNDLLRVAEDSYLYLTIAFGRVHTAMFGWKGQQAGTVIIGDKQIADVIAYMRSVENKTWDYIYPGSNPGSLDGGKKLFRAHCTECHGENGNGILAPQLNNQEFLSAATNGYILATITLGRIGTDMPSWGRGDEEHPALSGKERQDIVAFVRSWQVVKIKR
jgi:mono/diheme cytochrome c family protein